MAYVIKRYSNRKLYDTQESRYVTLEEIEEMIRAGKEISVVDAASGEDLTAVTLTQIILENQREMERVFQEWASRAGWGSMPPSTGAKPEPKRDGGTDVDAERLREEVSALRERLRSLEERLEKRKTQAK